MEDILKLTLIANSIDLEKLKDLSTQDYDALNAKAMLIIYSHVSGPARSHLHGISTAIGLLAKLREVYSNSNPISLKMLRDEYQACEIEDKDPNVHYSDLVKLQNRINSLTKQNKFILDENDLKYQFIISLLAHPTLSTLGNAWLVQSNNNTLTITIPEMVQALTMQKLQDQIIVTKRANTLPRGLDTRPKKDVTKRPCKFCQGDHWDRECKEAPDCYRTTPRHRVKDCPECQERFRNK